MALITGCPRSGTGYTAALLRENGIPCAHENKHQNDARHSSDWRRAHERHIVKVHVVRNPLHCISSLTTIQFPTHWKMMKNLIRVDKPNSFKDVDFLCRFWLAWTRLAAEGALARFRVEDLDEQLPELAACIREELPGVWTAETPTTFNGRQHQAFTWDDLTKTDAGKAVREQAADYGYDVEAP